MNMNSDIIPHKVCSSSDKNEESILTLTIHEIAYHLLSSVCHEFSLEWNIEFAAYELFDYYFESYCDDIIENMPSVLSCRHVEQDSTKNYKLNDVQDSSLSNLLAIISLCVKYFGSNWLKICQTFSNLFRKNEELLSLGEFSQIEFKIFRYLDFQVNIIYLGCLE